MIVLVVEAVADDAPSGEVGEAAVALTLIYMAAVAEHYSQASEELRQGDPWLEFWEHRKGKN